MMDPTEDVLMDFCSRSMLWNFFPSSLQSNKLLSDQVRSPGLFSVRRVPSDYGITAELCFK